jgi:hypothetical protein
MEPFCCNQRTGKLRRRTHALTTTRYNNPNDQTTPKKPKKQIHPPPLYHRRAALRYCSSRLLPLPSPNTSPPRGPPTLRPFRFAFLVGPFLEAEADVAVPAAVLPASARRAGRDLRQHPRCVHSLDPVSGDPAILAGCVCADSSLDLFVGVSWK